MKGFIFTVVALYIVVFVVNLVNMTLGVNPQPTQVTRALDILTSVIFIIWGVLLLAEDKSK